LARFFGLFTVQWIFGHYFSAFMVKLVVLFQQEIRRALMRVATNPLSSASGSDEATIEALAEAAFSLVHRGWGGLIVIERDTGLRHLYESGVEMDAPIRPDMIQAIFCPDAPMHDGAVIVSRSNGDGRIMAARALLPLAQANAVPGSFGTRHRAAVGLSEETDALVIVVSEEKGDVHLVDGGRLGEALTSYELRQGLAQGLNVLPSASSRAEIAS
jgi:diadenylate cyclase